MAYTSYSPSLAVVADVVRRALTRYPNERARIEKAATLIALGAVQPHTPEAYSVQSQTTASVVYLVTLNGCTCKDAERRPQLACKHRYACDLLSIAIERQRRLDRRADEQAERARFSADRVAIAYATAIGWR